MQTSRSDSRRSNDEKQNPTATTHSTSPAPEFHHRITLNRMESNRVVLHRCGFFRRRNSLLDFQNKMPKLENCKCDRFDGVRKLREIGHNVLTRRRMTVRAVISFPRSPLFILEGGNSCSYSWHDQGHIQIPIHAVSRSFWISEDEKFWVKLVNSKTTG